MPLEDTENPEVEVPAVPPPQTPEVIETPPPEPVKEPEVQEQPQEPIVEPAPPPPAPEPTPNLPIIEEPVAPTAPPTPDPIPEPPKPVEQPTPVKDEPVPKEPKAEPTPPIAPTPPPIAETPSPTPALAPAKHDPKYIKDVPKRVLELTEEEINAARKLWAREHIGAAQLQANKNRTARMNQRMDEIEKIIKAKPNISVHTIANSVQLSQKLTSGYLQKLVHAGRIKATGNTGNRRFY